MSISKKKKSVILLVVLVVVIVCFGAVIAIRSMNKEPKTEIVRNESGNLSIEEEYARQHVVKIDDAIKFAILDTNKGQYSEGECVGEGHILLDTADVTDKYNAKEGTNFIEAYVLATYGEYGFQNGIFTKISGSGVIPTRLTFSRNEKGEYSLTEYKQAQDGSLYTKSIKEMFPEKLWNRALSTTEADRNECQKQEEAYAEAYLKSINREAEIASNVNRDLANMNVTVSNDLLDIYYEYPYWLGTLEKIENGTRYVYEKKWEDKGNGNGTVTFIKYEYDTKNVVEEVVIEVKDGKMTYLKNNKPATQYRLGKEIAVDLNGDGKDESVYYGLDDFRINGTSYRNDALLTNVYEDNPSEGFFIIADTNINDKQKEIVLKVNGPSDDPAGYFYLYNNKLEKLGSVDSYITDKSFDGKGNIYGNVRLNILQTWWAPEVWKLENGKIARDEQKIYYPIQSAEQEITLNVDLPVLENLTDSKQPTVMKPQKVKITATDNKQFCYVDGEDGTKGWFEVKDFYLVVAVDNKPATDVFTGLVMAD